MKRLRSTEMICSQIKGDVNTNETWNERSYFAFLLLIAVVLLTPRLDGVDYFPGKYLWAEDGSIFLNQAQSLGLASIFTPYAGYLHLYPRVIALIANNFELLYRPLILSIGWLFAYIFMFATLIQSALNHRLKFISIVFLIALVSLQPNYGENFFNLTNSQWLLGASLSLVALVPLNSPTNLSLGKMLVLIVLGLTGPFSVVLVPILLLRLIVYKDFRQYYWLYLSVFACAAVQAFILLSSGRAAPAGIHAVLSDWIMSIVRIALLGADRRSAILAATLFWGLLIFALIKMPRRSNDESESNATPLILLFAAGLFVIAGLYSHKNDPLGIVVLGAGNRYTWIPYTLIFFAALLASKGRPILTAGLIATGLFVCYKNFLQCSSPNLQFESFARLAAHTNVVIPIQPQWPTFPGWHIDTISSGKAPLTRIEKQTVNLEHVMARNTAISFIEGRLQVQSTNGDPALLFTDKVVCQDASAIALEIDMSRHNEGWMQLFWAADGKFNEVNSLRRWYPADSVTAQFAFPNFRDGGYIRVDPLEESGNAEIHKISIHCLP